MSKQDKTALAKGALVIRTAEADAKGVKLDGTLTSVTKEILRLHNELESIARTTLDKAIRIGELLARVRASRKGKWLAWLESHVPFSHDTARNYIGVYKRRADPKLRTVRNLRDAYALLYPPKQAKARVVDPVVKEYVRKGIAADEKAARRILAEQSEQPDDATADNNAELKNEAPKPQPKGWQPDTLTPDRLIPAEAEIIAIIKTYADGRTEGRRKAFKRLICEGDVL